MIALALLSDLFGWAGAALSSALALPQMIALLRTREAIGLTALPWQALLASNFAWGCYGVAVASGPIIAANGISAVFSIVTICMIMPTARGRVLRLLTALAVGAAALTTVGMPVLFGLLTVTPSVLGWLWQLRQLIMRGRPRAFSTLGVVIYLLSQTLWLSHGILEADLALTVSAVPLVLAMIAVIVAAQVVPVRQAGIVDRYPPPSSSS